MKSGAAEDCGECGAVAEGQSFRNRETLVLHAGRGE